MPRAQEKVERIRASASGVARSAVSRASIPVWSVLGVVAAAIVVLLAFGGLEQALSSAPEVSEGDEVTLDLYSITVTDTEVTTEIEDQFLEAEAGEAFVVLSVRMENLSDATIGVGRSADRVESRLIGVPEPLLQLTGVTALDTGQSWRTDGSTGTVFLQPRVPADFQIAWRVDDASWEADTPRLEVYDARVRTGQILLSSDDVTWRRGDLAAVVTTEPR